MHGNRVVEVPLLGAHLDRNPNGLNRLIGPHADHVYANDALFLTDTNNLVSGRSLLRQQSVVHGREARAINSDLLALELFTRFRF